MDIINSLNFDETHKLTPLYKLLTDFIVLPYGQTIDNQILAFFINFMNFTNFTN
ncbi:MAG: hypothetical protein KBG30_02270 [Bacteroidales bacterium]|nr:hypothetical protein [Bacteroidales bacterium]NLP19776.1 hypothetical protein [Bacteroidales bacterium]HNY44482.1 hypothetical protein [Bacteroidales bacterium]